MAFGTALVAVEEVGRPSGDLENCSAKALRRDHTRHVRGAAR